MSLLEAQDIVKFDPFLSQRMTSVVISEIICPKFNQAGKTSTIFKTAIIVETKETSDTVHDDIVPELAHSWV